MHADQRSAATGANRIRGFSARRDRDRRRPAALGIPFEYARDPTKVGHQIREGLHVLFRAPSQSRCFLTRDLMEDA